MAAPDSTTVQFNFKTPGGALINLYASDPFKAKELLELAQDLAPTIASTEALLNGTNAAATGLGATPVSQETFTPPTQGPPPAFAQPAAQPQQAPAQSGPPAPSCIHGQMTYRSGTGKNGRAWQAYFCSAPKGAPDQCEPTWLK